MRRIRWWIGVPLAVFVGGILGAWPILPLGLVWSLAVPLSVFFGVMCAGLCAVWTGNLMDFSGTRSRITPVLISSVVSAVVAVAVVIAVARFLRSSLLEMLLMGFAVVAVGTSFAVWRFRGPRGRLGWGGIVVLVLAGVWAVALFLISPGIDGYFFDLGLKEAVLGPYRAAGYGDTTEWAVAVSVTVALAGIVAAAWLTKRGISGHEIERDAALTLSLVVLSMPIFILMLNLFPAEGP